MTGSLVITLRLKIAAAHTHTHTHTYTHKNTHRKMSKITVKNEAIQQYHKTASKYPVKTIRYHSSDKHKSHVKYATIKNSKMN